MITLLWILFWALAAALTVAAGWALHERRRAIAQSHPVVDDDAIQQILDTGELFVDDEPLNLQAIDEEEERFWSETWDEPDDWGSR